MRRSKQLVKSMIITIFISLIIIFLCEGYQFVNIRRFVVQKFGFLAGKRESVENIFIGILGNSIVTLIGYVLEYFECIKNLQKDVEYCYMDVRDKLFPYIDGNNTEMIYKIRKDDILLKMREIAQDYKPVLDFYLHMIKIVNRFIKDDIYKLELLDCDFCSKFVKAAFVITALHNHFLILSTDLLVKNICLKEYKKEYKSLKRMFKKEEIDRMLAQLKKQYKSCVQSEKKEKEYIESLNLDSKCKYLDAAFAFGSSE